MEEAVFYNLSQDETLGGDSPSIHKIPSQAALKAYIDAKAAASGPNYFYVEDASGSANTLTIRKSNNALADKVFEWSYDKNTWTEITVTDTTGVSLAVPANGRVYLRGDNGALATSSYYTNMITAANSAIGGDITTLLDRNGSQASLLGYALAKIFYLSNKIKAADALLLYSRNLGTNCYDSMFYGCTSLTTAPALPATTLAQKCYTNMFYGCTSLTTAPALPATTLANNCYQSMFQSCTSLTTAPALPATALAQNCYSNMFYGCTSLTTAPALPATTLATYSYDAMFRNCSNLVRIEVYATAWNTGYASNWLNNVAATGDFYNLGGATIPTGTNGIPSGWTEHTQLP